MYLKITESLTSNNLKKDNVAYAQTTNRGCTIKEPIMHENRG